MIALEQLTIDHVRPTVGTTYELDLGEHGALTLTLLSVVGLGDPPEGGEGPAGSVRRQPFSMEFRGLGVGSRVLAPVLAEADERGVPTTIHVETFNPAQRLYQRLGFREVSREAVYLKFERPVRAGASTATDAASD